MLTYLDQLREIGAPGVHLQTTSRSEAACRMYEAWDSAWSTRLSRMWRWKFPGRWKNGRMPGIVNGSFHAPPQLRCG